MYSVSDKALYDALNQSKMTPSELRDLFLKRGALVSLETCRKELAKEFSKYNHDYYDHQKIASILGATSRREKSTVNYINAGSVDLDSLLDAAEKLKSKIESEDDLCQIHVDGNKVLIDITYMSTDYNKSEFKQVVNKNAVIEIEPDTAGYSVRYPNNNTVKDYVGTLFSYADESLEGESLDTDEISLMNIESHVVRSDFFRRLITSIDGYKFADVTDAYVYHPKKDDGEYDSEEDDDFDDEKKASENVVHISKASLKGEGVLSSDELSGLYDRGFYIWRVRWKMKGNYIDSDMYECEAQFNNPEDFSDFSYIVIGAYKYKNATEYTTNKVRLSKEESDIISKKIEIAARAVMMDVVASVSKELSGESSEG